MGRVKPVLYTCAVQLYCRYKAEGYLDQDTFFTGFRNKTGDFGWYGHMTESGQRLNIVQGIPLRIEISGLIDNIYRNSSCYFS